MPRYLPRALDLLASLPRRSVSGPPLDANLGFYLTYSSLIGLLGFDIPRPTRVRAGQLWRARPDLRPLLLPLIEGNPCDEFARPARRAVEGGAMIAFGLWLERYPELRPVYEPIVIKRARAFNQTEQAVDWGLVWARVFGGGDEAWRAIALAIKRSDRREGWRGKDDQPAFRSDQRYYLENGIVGAEAQALDEHLRRLGQDPIEPRDVWWEWLPIRENPVMGRYLAQLAYSSLTFAGGWTEEDEAIYAAAYARLPSCGHGDFRWWAAVDPVVARIATNGAALSDQRSPGAGGLNRE